MSEPILITVTGDDAPGITAELTAILAAARARLLDVEQVVVGDKLSLSFQVDLPEDHGPVLKDLLFQARELGVHLDFLVSPTPPRRSEERSRYALTLLASEIGADALAATSSLLAAEGWNIDRIARLAGSPVSCLELVVSGEGERPASVLRDRLLSVSRQLGVDVALQPEGLLRRVKRLVVMDMDSTLIQQEIIDELAALWGVGDRVAAITARAMAGDLPFRDSLRERTALLAGAPAALLEQVQERIHLTEGAEAFCRALRRLGYRLAVISGGFLQVVDPIRRRLELDYAFANRLEIVDGRLTGGLVGGVVDGQRKADLLESLTQQEGLDLDQVIAIGDGANDIDMLRLAGLGIAFNAKPRVQEQAGTAINQRSLLSVLHLLGIHGRELEGLDVAPVD